MNPILGFENRSHTNNHVQLGIGGKDKNFLCFLPFLEYPAKEAKHMPLHGTVLDPKTLSRVVRYSPWGGDASAKRPRNLAGTRPK